MNQNKSALTPKLRQNWWIDAILGISAVVAILSSIYFLVFPVSGYQGGRNPYYNITVIFDKEGWDVLHTWSGVLMIMAALVHIVIHWEWITATAGRTWKVIIGKRKPFSSRLTYNIVLDATIAISFIICAVSSVYFLFAPHGNVPGTEFIFTKTTWDIIHTWSGVIMTMAAILHFALHWKWVVNITRKVFDGKQKSQKAVPTPSLEATEETV